MTLSIPFVLLFFMSAMAFAGNCEIKPGPKGGLALFKNNKMITVEHTDLPELAFEDLEDFQRSGKCAFARPQDCVISPFGKEGLFVKRNGVRVSDSWGSMPEFAFNSLVRLIDIGYCEVARPRTCKVVKLKANQYVIQSNGQRISQNWYNKVLVDSSLKRLRKIGYCL